MSNQPQMTPIEAIAKRAAESLDDRACLDPYCDLPFKTRNEMRDLNRIEVARLIRKELAPLAKVLSAAEFMMATKPKSADRISAMNNLRQALSALKKEEA